MMQSPVATIDSEIDERFPELQDHLKQIVESASNAAYYVKDKYDSSGDKQLELLKTKQACADFLSVVTHTIRDMTDILIRVIDSQEDDMKNINFQLSNVHQKIDQQKAKRNDNLAANATITRDLSQLPRQMVKELNKTEDVPYVRSAISYAVYDHIGKGVKDPKPAKPSNSMKHRPKKSQTVSKPKVNYDTIRKFKDYKVKQTPQLPPRNPRSILPTVKHTKDGSAIDKVLEDMPLGTVKSESISRHPTKESVEEHERIASNVRTESSYSKSVKEEEEETESSSSKEASCEYIKGTALYDFESRDDSELAMKAGQTVYIIEEYDDGWGQGFIDDEMNAGYFPLEYVEKNV